MLKKASLIAALLLCLSLITVAQDNKVESGTINGANFRIEVPANWNNGLVMYCHSYALAGSTPNLEGGKQCELAGG